MQLRFLPLMCALVGACSNESAPPNAAGALGGIPKTYSTAESPPPAEAPPVTGAPPVAKPAPTTPAPKLNSRILSEHMERQTQIVQKLSSN